MIPRLLSLWCSVESAYFKLKLRPEIMGIDTAPDIKILFDGHDSWESLVQILLSHKIPLISIVRKNPLDGQWSVVAESTPAIPDPYVFSRAMDVCILRIFELLERAKQNSYGRSVSLIQGDKHVSNASVIAFIIQAVAEKVGHLIKSRFLRADHWQMAYGDIEEEWKLLFPDEPMLQADPFMWQSGDGLIHIFYEYMPYSTGKGVIKHISYDPVAKNFSAPKTVLECPYHLSFPYLFEFQGQIYMMPETGGNRTIEIYKAVQFPDVWVLEKTVQNDLIANDTVFYHDGSLWWMFTSIGVEGQKNWDELSLFYSDSPFGEWTPHPQNPIVSDCRSARMAGNIYKDDEGRLIRPTQDCTHGYGVALNLCEIEELTPSSYKETVIKHIDPPKGYTGTHTVNRIRNFCIFDVKSMARK